MRGHSPFVNLAGRSAGRLSFLHTCFDPIRRPLLIVFLSSRVYRFAEARLQYRVTIRGYDVLAAPMAEPALRRSFSTTSQQECSGLRFTSGVTTAAPENRALRTRQGEVDRSGPRYPQDQQPSPRVVPRLSMPGHRLFHRQGSPVPPLPNGDGLGQGRFGQQRLFHRESGIGGPAPDGCHRPRSPRAMTSGEACPLRRRPGGQGSTGSRCKP